MQWLGQSPDLNSTENLWTLQKKQLAKYESLLLGLDELWNRVQEEWNKIPRQHVKNLVENMPNRKNSVIKAKGL